MKAEFDLEAGEADKPMDVEIAILLKERGQAILVIDKNVDALTRNGDRHYIVERGQIVWEGNSSELSSNEELQHRYLGV